MRSQAVCVFTTVVVQFLLGGSAFAAPSPPMPANTIDCKDWQHLPGGAWRARANAKPFDIGETKGIQMQDQTVDRRDISFGDYDLASLLDRKCGTF